MGKRSRKKRQNKSQSSSQENYGKALEDKKESFNDKGISFKGDFWQILTVEWNKYPISLNRSINIKNRPYLGVKSWFLAILVFFILLFLLQVIEVILIYLLLFSIFLLILSWKHRKISPNSFLSLLCSLILIFIVISQGTSFLNQTSSFEALFFMLILTLNLSLVTKLIFSFYQQKFYKENILFFAYGNLWLAVFLLGVCNFYTLTLIF